MKCSEVYPTDADTSATSSRLLRDARRHDQEAWERLVRVYSRRMYRWCRRAGLQPADAANVVQEAFQAVARKLDAFQRDRPGGTFRGWLRRIVENKIRDHFRRLGRRHDLPVGGTDAHRRITNASHNPAVSVDNFHTRSISSGVSGEGPHEATHTSDAPDLHAPLAEVVHQIRGEVGERNWKFFWRTAVDGQSAAEVGREFGVSANAVRIVKMRVLRRLRENLGDLAPE